LIAGYGAAALPVRAPILPVEFSTASINSLIFNASRCRLFLDPAVDRDHSGNRSTHVILPPIVLAHAAIITILLLASCSYDRLALVAGFVHVLWGGIGHGPSLYPPPHRHRSIRRGRPPEIDRQCRVADNAGSDLRCRRLRRIDKRFRIPVPPE
jgi:hypothetical protein